MAAPMATATIEVAIQSATRLVNPPALCLGSASASRRALLAAALGIEVSAVEYVVPDIDEKAIGDRAGGDARMMTRRIAVAKADALLANPVLSADLRARGVWLITGDQVVTDGGAVGLIREKPRNHAELAEFLRTYASGGPAATVGALCVHDVATGARAVVSHVATVKFAADWPPEDIAGLLASPELRFCAGGLMVEHALMARHITCIEGGVDSIMGLSTSSLGDLIATVGRVNASGGDMLARPDLRRWAVVGDSLNRAKPAFRVAAKLEGSGRDVARVNPRDQTGATWPSMAAAFSEASVHACNLIISPTIGLAVIEDAARLGVEDVFMQPGADAPHVVAAARELGLRVQKGCVLVQGMSLL